MDLIIKDFVQSIFSPKKTKKTKSKSKTKNVTKPETKPVIKPETKPVIKPETKAKSKDKNNKHHYVSSSSSSSFSSFSSSSSSSLSSCHLKHCVPPDPCVNCDKTKYNINIPVPVPVQNLIGPCEKVSFTGTYLLANRRLQSINDTNDELASTISTIPMNIPINPGYNLLVSVAFPTNNKLIPPTPFILRNATISSFAENDLSIKTGQIVASDLYQEGVGPNVISTTVQRYDISSASGIYKNISGLIIDFSGPSSEPRTVYFLVKCS